MTSFTHYRVKTDVQVPILENSKDIPSDSYLETLRNRLKIKILSIHDNEMVFDLIGVDTSIANALRRILLAEVQKCTQQFYFLNDILFRLLI